jgi:DNA invertase Pin-like site-specific DNA recombinase
MGKAIIYVRVSSSRQVENTSLESQEAACREWCARNGLDVDRVFIEHGESARTANRTEFQNMFRYLERKHATISHLVIDKFDRFSRSVDEGAKYRIKLRSYEVLLSSVKEPIDNTPAGKLYGRILDGFAEYDNDVRAQRGLTGMKANLQAGKWVWVAPLGYRNGHATSEPSLLQDLESAPLIAKFFELVASGKRASEAISHVNSLGLKTKVGKPISIKTATKWLRKPIYCGIIEYPKWGISSVKGDFQPIITEELFKRVQDVLAGRAIVTKPHRRQNPNFPLRGVLLCPACGLAATGSTSKGKTKRYAYYHCHRVKRHLRVSATLVDAKFQTLLDRLQPTENRMKLVEEIFRRVWSDKQATAHLEAQQLNTELARLEVRKQRILDRMVDGTLGKDDFERLYEEVKAQIETLKSNLILAERSVIDVDTALSYLKHLF